MLVPLGEVAIRSAGAADIASQISQTPSANVFSRLRAFHAITPLFVNSDIPFADELVADTDYRVSDQFVLGSTAEFINAADNIDFSVGIGDNGERSLSFYGAYSRDNFFIDGLIGFGRNEYDLESSLAFALQPSAKRTIDDAALNQSIGTDAEAEKFFVGLGMGYRFSKGALSLTPSLRFDYADVDVAGLGEPGSGLNISDDITAFDDSDQRFKSMTSTLGGQLSYSMDQEWGVIVPFGRIAWVHEFEDDVKSYTSQLLDQSGSSVLSAPIEDPDRDYFNLGLGVSAQFGSGRAAFLSYEQVFGKENTGEYSITGGVRFEF